MTASSEAMYLASAEGIHRAEPGAIGQLTEAIAISGLSMSILDGETSPSSGGEHIISHYWDLMNHIEDAPRNLHGAQVGVGTMIMLAAYEYLRELDPCKFESRETGSRTSQPGADPGSEHRPFWRRCRSIK